MRSELSSTDQRVYRSGPLLGKLGLDQLMPMHIWAGPTGHILRAGPTLMKLRPDSEIVGQRLTELLEFRRPRRVQLMSELRAYDGKSVQVSFRSSPRTSLKGHVVSLPKRQGVLLNFSLGIAMAEIVRSFGLKSKDFAASDPTVEMLYLIEAQSAILDESKKLNTRLQGARIAAEEQAFTDTLTGLKNRRALDHVLTRVTDQRSSQRFGLMHVDLDYFKSVNDTYGHAAGDYVLQEAARIMVEETRAEDLVARTGGDEFVIVLMGCVDKRKLNQIAERIISRLEQPIQFDGAECRVSASIGITVSSLYETLDAEQICSDADVALYQSKDRGRACFTMYGPN
ncbi:MAG: GGDEF domain-containing protein [Alphaproteobacteria bacterium]|nr:GGDEF domain-containing protein [Alphaproteobacteria bacterium]